MGNFFYYFTRYKPAEVPLLDIQKSNYRPKPLTEEEFMKGQPVEWESIPP